MSTPAASRRPLTGFEQVLLGVLAQEPRSGYGLKKMFNASPAAVYQPSSGALYPALRRLAGRGLLHTQRRVSSGRRTLSLYQVTDAGTTAHLAWLTEPVDPVTVGADLGLHLMRFTMMENNLPPEAVLAFLADLADALDRFITTMQHCLASVAASPHRHGKLALQHGIAVHQASLDWTRTTLAALATPTAQHSHPGH